MAEFIDPVEDPTGLLPTAGTPVEIKVSESDTIGREPTSKTNRLENEAKAPAGDVDSPLALSYKPR